MGKCIRINETHSQKSTMLYETSFSIERCNHWIEHHRWNLSIYSQINIVCYGVCKCSMFCKIHTHTHVHTRTLINCAHDTHQWSQIVSSTIKRYGDNKMHILHNVVTMRCCWVQVVNILSIQMQSLAQFNKQKQHKIANNLAAFSTEEEEDKILI